MEYAGSRVPASVLKDGLMKTVQEVSLIIILSACKSGHTAHEIANLYRDMSATMCQWSV